MRANVLKELLLYRYRYILGYGILILLGVVLTVWQLGNIPPGFSQAEVQSAVQAFAIAPDATSLINAPYLFLQKGTLLFFGAGASGIRIPSVICAVLLGFAMHALLRRWFSANLAIIGTILIITSSHFLLRGRTGSPVILYSLLTTVMLAAAVFTNQQVKGQRFWFWLLVLAAGLSLYVPLLSFLTLTIAIVGFASKQGRGVLEEIGPATLSISAFTLAIVAAPLAYSLYQQPSGALELLGIASIASPAESLGHARLLLASLFDVTAHSSQQILTPLFSIPATLLFLYGLFYTVRNLRTARYAGVLLLSVVSTLLYISFNNAQMAIVVIPISLIMVIGVWHFINRWYGLFPRNPYARVAALLPIAILLLVMVQFNYNRFFYGVARSADVRDRYDGDLKLAKLQLQRQPVLQSGTLVVSDKQLPFYRLLTITYPNLKVLTPAEAREIGSSGAYIVAESETANVSVSENAIISRLIVDDRPDQALRFRVYR